MNKFLHLLFFTCILTLGFSQNPKIKVSYKVARGMVRSYDILANTINNIGQPCVETSFGNKLEVRVHAQFRSSTGITNGREASYNATFTCPSGTCNSCTTGSTTLKWGCEQRCETSTNGGSCGVWVNNSTQNSAYPGDPGYVDTSAYPSTDVLEIQMKGFETDDFSTNSNTNLDKINYNYNDGACQTTCANANCYGNYQIPTSGRFTTIDIGSLTNTVLPFSGSNSNWSPYFDAAYEGPNCALDLDGYHAYYYLQWQYRWVWDDTTLFNRHAGSINSPSPIQVCNKGLFNVTNNIEAFEASKGYSLYQWQYSNNGTTWVNFTNGTNTAADLIGASINHTTGSTTYYIRREATFCINFVANASYGKRKIYSDTTSIVVLPTPTFTDPTLNAAMPTNGTTICKGLDVSATFIAGGGTPYFDAFDEFQYSLNGVSNWTAYIPASNINTAFASGDVKIRGRRMSSCTATDTAWTNLVNWPVYGGTTSPSVASSSIPINSEICTSISSISGVISAGSGGADFEYGYSISNGSSPDVSTIVSGISTPTTSFTINSIGATTKINLFARRTNVGAGPCLVPAWGLIAYWKLINEPINPTLNTQTPNATSICETESVSATFNPGAQGASNAVDQYQISIDNGANWNAYSPGEMVSALGGNTSVIIRGTRTVDAFSGCMASWVNLASWNIDKIPTGTPTYNLSVCAGGTSGTATLDMENLSPPTTNLSWVRSALPTSLATPTSSIITPFVITNLTKASRYVVTLTNGLCLTADSINIPLVAATTPATTVVIAPNSYCANCSFVNNSTRYFYDDAGRIIATANDPNAPNTTLGSTEICVDVDPVQQFITDDLGIQQPYLRRRWTIKPAINTTATVILYFTAAELNDLKAAAGTVGVDPYAFVTPIGNLLITKYPNGGNGIFTEPLSAGAELIVPIPVTGIATNGTNWKVTFSVSTFSTFYIHPKREFSSALPVELISFNANIDDVNNYVNITWSTASEENSKVFLVEKSIDGYIWDSIGNVIAKGNSNVIANYSFVDNNPNSRIIYYRLKMIDLDNSFKYSNIISINTESVSNQLISLYPNPTNNLIKLSFNKNANKYSLVEIKDVVGRIVKTVKIENYNKNNFIEINCQNIANGSYYVSVYDDNNLLINTIKLVKY